MYPRVPTFGVEEEFLTADPVTFDPVEKASYVESLLPESFKSRYHKEFYSCTVEMVTSVCTTADELYEQISSSRKAAGQAALQAECLLLAVGVPPTGNTVYVTPGVSRYKKIKERFGSSVFQSIFGQHTHVGVESKELALQVCNHIRPWLPIIQALSSNSAFANGRYTKYESWRAFIWRLWPSAISPLLMENLDDYNEFVNKSVTSGIMLNRNMVYWFARPSDSYPTVEIRIGDICLTAQESVLIAVIVRALVESLVRDIANGALPFDVPDYQLNAAHWRAARYGMTGDLVNLVTGNLTPAVNLSEALFYKIAPVLSELHNYDLVRDGLEKIYNEGTGSQRQLAAYTKGGMQAVIELLKQS